MATMVDDPHFRNFAVSLEHAIARWGESEDEDFLARQKRQVETLVALEKEFKRTLIGHSKGEKIYKAFVKFICDDRKNILDARPYFRERQHIFTKYISTALRKRHVRGLYRFNFNFRFVQFVMNYCAWRPRSPLRKIADAIQVSREELITMNMPLAISRARIFYSRTPKAHLTYMDLIQIACEGLMSGIDKFVLPFSKAFRSVAIGRMTGNFIENYSETQIHFFPVDKRKLYRANKMVGRGASSDFDEIAAGVNRDVAEKAHRTTAAEIANLMSAASTVSSDTPIGDDEDEVVRVADRFAAPIDVQPDVICERQDSLTRLGSAMSVLNEQELKVLKLRGVSL